MPSETVIAKGMIDRLGLSDSVFTAKYGDNQKFKEVQDVTTHEMAATLLLTRLKELGIVSHLDEVTGVGHRVVGGGEAFSDSMVINPVALDEINRLAEYAPLHNPTQAYYIKIFTTLLPGVPQVAVLTPLFTVPWHLKIIYTVFHKNIIKNMAQENTVLMGQVTVTLPIVPLKS